MQYVLMRLHSLPPRVYFPLPFCYATLLFLYKFVFVCTLYSMQNNFTKLLIGLNVINVPQSVVYQRTG